MMLKKDLTHQIVGKVLETKVCKTEILSKVNIND